MNRGFFTFSTKPSLIPVATGGTTSYSGAYKYHRFTSSSSFIVKEKGYVDVLVVGGGRAGGSTAAGGGGGGGVVLRLNYYVDIGTIPVRVGAGGLIGNSRGNGNNGDFSAFGIIIAEGGGGGCGYDASPESINKARNGGCGGGDAWERLSVNSVLIPIGLPPQTVADRALLIGDAAGQVKPLSGGGLYTGMVAARLAAKTALECLERGDFSSPSLSVYEDRWRAEMGKELDRGYLIRKAFLRLSDHRLAELARALNREDVRSVLSEDDIDFPSDLASKVLRTAPSLVRFGPSLLFSLLPKGARNAK